MALARLLSRGQLGLDAYPVSVEVHIAGGLPGFAITGLPTAAVRESRDRVRAALHTCGWPLPAKRITVHLGPADIPKEGGRFDLPIALGILLAEREPGWRTDDIEFIGELSLAGELRAIDGVVPATLAAAAAGRRLILPRACSHEAALVPAADVGVASRLSDVIAELDGGSRLTAPAPMSSVPECPSSIEPVSLDEVGGHAVAKRVLMIAAAGGHNLLMIGPPGSGKSMLAERLPGLLPPLDDTERLEVASIESVAGIGRAGASGHRRRFRSPHHTTPATALVGGGARPRPGEVSLAHRGVLFLDELPEFSRAALEALREPLESGSVTVSRVRAQTRYPAAFQLIAAMNPCPCGYFGDGTPRCECPPARLAQYRSRVSGPLLDRFDLHVEVQRVPIGDLGTRPDGLGATEVVDAVRRARALQQDRRGSLNRTLDGQKLWAAVSFDPAARKLMDRAETRWCLSTRSLIRVLRVARTIADLESEEAIGAAHVAEALQYRILDRPAPG